MPEVERLLHHLDRSGRSGEGLKIRLVGDAHLLAAVREVESPRELAEGLVDTVTVERRLGRRFRAGSEESGGDANEGCDRMFARLMLSRRVPDHYATAAVLAVHRTKQAGRTLKAAGLAMLLAGRGLERVGVAPLQRPRRDRGGLRPRSERLRSPLPGGNGCRNPGSHRTTSGSRSRTAQRLDSGRVLALPILRTVSEALAGFPDLALESLEWFEISEREGWAGPPDEDAPREQFRVVHLRGRVEPFNGHYRAAADEVFRFADGLEANPRLSEVDVTDLPRDPGGGGLRHRPAAGFEMRMVLDVRND